MRKAPQLTLLALAAVTLLALRVWVAPRLLELDAPASIWRLRGRIALAGAVAGAGLGVAAVGSQARAREAAVDASLTGPAWGALPALLLPAPVPVQALAAVGGAGLVAWSTKRGPTGLANVLARGVAVAGLVVSLAALGLFLGPGLTPSTATAFLHAALGGRLLQATGYRVAVGAVIVLAAAVLAWIRSDQLLLTRTGLTGPDRSIDVVVALAAGGAVLVAGVVAGVGLLATRAARPIVGEHPRALVPAAVFVGAGLTTGIDALAQTLAWPGELPVGLVTTVAASILLVWRLIPRDRSA